jgi:hypothetical protein
MGGVYSNEIRQNLYETVGWHAVASQGDTTGLTAPASRGRRAG